ncbi:Small ubiquitin-related modifier 1 [Vitis vinifera]|uniref:Small ubiquitin-related modifier 1 n=1 Tax=Vitis vinifera TaxID=29760 RepID=A0A438CJ95_VITVI|nr:Small ubiquitin-related modifier 1 [Vitis vinifera]
MPLKKGFLHQAGKNPRHPKEGNKQMPKNPLTNEEEDKTFPRYASQEKKATLGGKEKQGAVLFELGFQCGSENDLDYWWEDGNEVFFRIKRSTQLKKLMNAYCDRQSVDLNSIAFLFDGRRLRGEQTPDELEMEDGDEIDAMLHQTGGACV